MAGCSSLKNANADQYPRSLHRNTERINLTKAYDQKTIVPRDPFPQWNDIAYQIISTSIGRRNYVLC